MQEEEKGKSSTAAPTIIPSSSPTSDDKGEPKQSRMGNLQNLYESTSEVHLVCLLAVDVIVDARSDKAEEEDELEDADKPKDADMEETEKKEEVKEDRTVEVAMATVTPGSEKEKEGNVRMSHVASRDQVADIFTKSLPKELFENFKMMIGMKDGRCLSLREEFVNG